MYVVVRLFRLGVDKGMTCAIIIVRTNGYSNKGVIVERDETTYKMGKLWMVRYHSLSREVIKLLTSTQCYCFDQEDDGNKKTCQRCLVKQLLANPEEYE